MSLYRHPIVGATPGASVERRFPTRQGVQHGYGRPRERWYLYGDDVALADDWLRRDLDQAQTAAERAWLLKHWPSLGGFELLSSGWFKGTGAPGSCAWASGDVAGVATPW